MDAAALIDRLRAAGFRLATAESCTGGLATSTLVDVPGASDVINGGVIAYSDDAKQQLLGVETELLTQFGSVSGAVAEAMAHGAREATKSDVALAITGIAGPEGGVPGKPVGTVWLAAVGPGPIIQAHKAHFEGARDEIRRKAVEEGFAMIAENLDEHLRDNVT